MLLFAGDVHNIADLLKRKGLVATNEEENILIGYNQILMEAVIARFFFFLIYFYFSLFPLLPPSPPPPPLLSLLTQHHTTLHHTTTPTTTNSHSAMIGSSVMETNFRDKYEAAIISIFRGGEPVHGKVGDIVLAAGFFSFFLFLLLLHLLLFLSFFPFFSPLPPPHPPLTLPPSPR